MYLKFNNIFSCEATWTLKTQNKGLIQELPLGVFQNTQSGSAWRGK